MGAKVVVGSHVDDSAGSKGVDSSIPGQMASRNVTNVLQVKETGELQQRLVTKIATRRLPTTG